MIRKFQKKTIKERHTPYSKDQAARFLSQRQKTMDDHNDNKIKFLRDFREKSEKDARRAMLEEAPVANERDESRLAKGARIESRSESRNASEQYDYASGAEQVEEDIGDIGLGYPGHGALRNSFSSSLGFSSAPLGRTGAPGSLGGTHSSPDSCTDKTNDLDNLFSDCEEGDFVEDLDEQMLLKGLDGTSSAVTVSDAHPSSTS